MRRKFLILVRLCAAFGGKMLVANFKLARDTLQPSRVRPGLVRVPLANRSPGVVSLLACMVTLTPGTIAVDVVEDGSVLLVHAVDVREPSAVVDDVREFDRSLEELFS
jgi:multisubunit Na+/H+ antiporter MnhE subunit